MPRRDWVRKVDFELKYGCPEDPRYFAISGRKDMEVRIDVMAAPEQEAPAPRQSRVRSITAGTAMTGTTARSWVDRDE